MRTASAFLAIAVAASIGVLAMHSPGTAQESETPYWATIRTTKLNMRAGPGRDYPITWVYKRKGLPLKVVRVHEGWRLVRDPDGDEGWMTANLLSRERGALVIGQGLAPMRDAPTESGRLKWNLEPGVVGKLGECEAGWCTFEVTGHSGYVSKARLWGASVP
ncbi:SH3 domain-containing protein [Tsuneonella mangrovi]|uniref:SH3 domain-containing protein n=1 Tax=Tsuneonella mangrovi TaxID=1982042 RepID=UPI001F0B510F|nr:SH3 domain-containing protein [Tsuneonella mangrovi]